MLTPSDPNRQALETVAIALGAMRDEVVFIGGAAVGLLISDSAAPLVRVTKDVDCILEVATRAEYFGRIRNQLIAHGFAELIGENIPICAWHLQGLRLDVMPTDEAILGFSNPWYTAAARHATVMDLGAVRIRVIRPEYFIATKLAAFRSRGRGDYLASHDIEDLVAVIDGRAGIGHEISLAESEIRTHLAESASMLLADSRFLDALPGHVVDPGREDIVLIRLAEIGDLR